MFVVGRFAVIVSTQNEQDEELNWIMLPIITIIIVTNAAKHLNGPYIIWFNFI